MTPGWVAWALLSAIASAATNAALKRTVDRGSVVGTTVAFRLVTGALLAVVVWASGGWPAPTAAYWRAAALVIPPEVGGMLFMSLALRAGDLSEVQPLLGALPLLVMLEGIVLLGELPTRAAAGGIVLVGLGIYCAALRGGSALAPLRALARSRASWFAVLAALSWSFATVVHRIGIAAVGPFPWAVTLMLGSALALGLPMLAWTRGVVRLPARPRAWAGLVLVTGALFAVQQAGLHLALQRAPAGYVTAVTATSTLIAIALGVALLGERSGFRARLAGGVLVSLGAALIALAG